MLTLLRRCTILSDSELTGAGRIWISPGVFGLFSLWAIKAGEILL
jgi:hypothetical protein